MFAISERKSLTMTSSKGRKEFHNDAQVQALDLKFSGAWSNESLAMFHAALPAALFTKEGPAASDDVQEEMRLPVADLDVLRFSKLNYPLKWDYSIIGATVSLWWGTGKPIVLSLCKVTDFTFEPINGGSVQINFRVSSAADITEKILGRTGIMMGDEVEITLEPPVVAEDEPKPPKPAPEPAATPESLFTQTAGEGEGQEPATEGADGGWPFGGDGPAAP